MELNRKGFTLVELLVTIVIIGLVVGFSTYGIISLINNSEDKTITLSVDNLKEAARIYSAEAGSDSWKKTEYDYDAFCVTISELMNKGLLDQNAEIEGQRDRKDFIIVKRNKITLAIENEEIVSSTNNSICTGEIEVEGEKYTRPKVESSTSYTDKLIINFTPGTASYQDKESTITYKCLYGTSSSNINREGKIIGNTCEIDNLKNTDENNIKIPYYVYIYMNTNYGTNVLAEDSKEYYTLADFSTQEINQNKNIITISYNDTDVLIPSHYFKSTINGTAGSNVEKCTLKNNIFTCNEITQTIEENTWYKVNRSNISITYPEENNTVNIVARIQDGSNNYKENTKTFNIKKYTVKFYKNTASSIGGSTNNYIEKYCIAAGNNSCSITSPSITANTGYSVVGWNTTSTSTSSSWNVNDEKNINSNLSYYAITRANKVYIKYDTNGGSLATKSNSAGTWSEDSNGVVSLNGSATFTIINYGGSIGSSGLANYNNSNWLNISRTGYTAVSEAEWKCLSGCSGTYNQATNYSASDFCDASSSDCEVTLGVNWIDNVGPTFGNVEVTNITSSGYDICVYDVEDPSGINRVQFPTWTGSASSSNDQEGDIQSNWEYNSVASGTDKGGGTWCYRVNVSDHNNESGNYNTHIYMYDSLENRSNTGENDITVPSAVIAVDYTRFTYSGKKITVYHFNSVNSSNVYTYDKLNGLSNNGTLSGTVYTKTELKNKLSPSTYYFADSEMQCYNGASTSSGKAFSYTFKWCDNWMNSTGKYEPNYISVWETTTSGWWYSSGYDCYVQGSELGSLWNNGTGTLASGNKKACDEKN